MVKDNEQLSLFGLRVRLYRNRLGLSQEQLAAKANVHRTYIGTVERGETNITLLNIYKLAKALQVDVEELINNYDTLSSLKQ